MARYFISSFNNSYFFSSYNGLSARLYQINLCKERFIIKLRWTFKVQFLNPCKVQVCCPVAINCPNAGTIQNPIVAVVFNHGAKALQRSVYQSFLNLCKVAIYCPVARVCAEAETFQSLVAVAIYCHGAIKMSKGENQSLNPRNRSCGFSFQPKTVNKALVLYLAITFSICYVGDFVDAFLSTDKNLASE